MIQATQIIARGLGLREIDQHLPAFARIHGPTGSGKSQILRALEIAARGRATGSSIIPQTVDGVLMLARDHQALSVELYGESDERGPWSVVREYTTRMVAPKNGEGPPIPKCEGDCSQTFVEGVRGPRENDATVQEHLSTLPEIWRPFEVMSESANKRRQKILGRLAEGGSLDEWAPKDLPDWLRKFSHLAPEPWVRICIETTRAELVALETDSRALVAVVEASAGGRLVELGPLEGARDRALVELTRYDEAQRRAADRVSAEAEVAAAEHALAESAPPLTPRDALAVELLDAQRRDGWREDLRALPADRVAGPSTEAVEAARRARDAAESAATEARTIERTELDEPTAGGLLSSLKKELSDLTRVGQKCWSCGAPATKPKSERIADLDE